jgi:hypothetical protein
MTQRRGLERKKRPSPARIEVRAGEGRFVCSGAQVDVGWEVEPGEGVGEESVGLGPRAADSCSGAVKGAGECGLGVGVDEDQGDRVGVRMLLGERASAFEASIADPYGDVTTAGPRGRPLSGGEHRGELCDGLVVDW